MRGSSLLIVAGTLALGLALGLAVTGCSRRETEAQMRERVRRQEQQRQQRLAREREQQEIRRRLLLKQRHGVDAARRAPPASGGEVSMSADAMGREMKSESADAQAAAPRVPPRRPRVATMSAPLRYRPARPAPRRRLKRPRRHRSPSLEGLFE